MIDSGDKNLSEFFVKYEKGGCQPFLMPKSAKKCQFSVQPIPVLMVDFKSANKLSSKHT